MFGSPERGRSFVDEVLVVAPMMRKVTPHLGH